MKCPNCRNNQKYKDGMRCNMCQYKFALDPKEYFNISDAAFKAVIDKLSGAGQFYYTYNQLYVQVYKAVRKKHHVKFFELSCFGIILVLITFALMGSFKVRWEYIIAVSFILFCILMFLTSIASKRPFKLEAKIPARIITTYKSLHPLKNLADGTKFRHLNKKTLDTEFLEYAPEQILITERNDMADMLLFNRFHFDNKTLVLSAKKYPGAAFNACQGFLANHPDIPVFLIHDCSEEGLKMQGKLLTNKSWNLKGKNLNNLGLHPKDVDNLKSPVWIPANKDKNILTQGSAHENINQGFTMPLDIASPSAIIGSLTMAITTGMALLSNELLKAQRESADRGGFGCGFG